MTYKERIALREEYFRGKCHGMIQMGLQSILIIAGLTYLGHKENTSLENVSITAQTKVIQTTEGPHKYNPNSNMTPNTKNPHHFRI